jgi:sulfite reductase (ferredoxin)
VERLLDTVALSGGRRADDGPADHPAPTEDPLLLRDRAIVETKQRADWLYRELEERLPEFDEPIKINLNGCPNSCARFQVADIGLMGSLVALPDGKKVDGYQVHLGGHLGEEARFGRKVRGVKVPAYELADYVERLLRRYLNTRQEGEPFHRWAERAPEGWVKQP